MSSPSPGFVLAVGYVGWALILLWVGVQLVSLLAPRPQSGRTGWQAWLVPGLVGGVLALAALPGLLFLRSSFGDPAISTAFLAGWAVWDKLRPAHHRIDAYSGDSGRMVVWRRRLAAIIAMTGAVLYGSALGPVDVDLYAWGYTRAGSVWLLLAVAVLSLMARQVRSVISWAMPIACIAFGLGLTVSTNLWDAVLDPWLWITACVTSFMPKSTSREEESFDVVGRA
jgi:hypothetical protein